MGFKNKAIPVFIIVVVLLAVVVYSVSLPTPIETYAREKGLPSIVIAKLRIFGSNQKLDQSVKDFVDYVSVFEESLQQKIIDGFLSDRKLTSQETKQIDFLKQFPIEEQIRCIENETALNTDWDGDNYSNWFEKFIAHTPYDVKNEIYVIFLSQAGPEVKDLTEMYDLLTKAAKIQKDHVYWFHHQNSNSTSLEHVINSVSQIAGKNNIVLVMLSGEGAQGLFGFWKGNLLAGYNDVVSYQWINDKLEKIDSRAMPIVIDSCHSGSAIPYLEDRNKPRIILTSSSANETCDFGIEKEFLKAFLNKSADKNGNGYVTVGEAAEYAKKTLTGSYTDPAGTEILTETPQISDINNIGPNLYLFELEVDK